MAENFSARKKTLIVLVCVLSAVIYAFPLYLLVNVSLREATDLSSRLLPTQNPSLRTFRQLLRDRTMWRCFGNTLIWSVLEIMILIPLASLGGYGLARSKGRFVGTVRSLNVLIMLIPGTALLVGRYSMMVRLHLTNSLLGMALLGAGSGMTESMFFYTTFIKSIPTELDEAAAIDGAGVLTTFFRIIFPQLKGVTVTRIVTIVIGCWNSYLMPMYLLTRQDKYTVLLYVRRLFGNGNVADVPLAFAGAAVMVVPILVFYFAMQRHIVGGQLDGASKG